MEHYYIEKPDLSSIDKTKVLESFIPNSNKYIPLINAINEPRYLYWDEAKYKKTPEGMNQLEFWYLVKQVRKLGSKLSPIKAETGEYFTWLRPNYIDEYLHKIDFYTGGQIFTTYDVQSDLTKQKFVGRGILEEAIASSQIEGANTTRSVAKKLILEKRVPRNKSELMILNNYNTMKSIDETYKDQDLSIDLIFEIHANLTRNDLKRDEQFRFRCDDDEVVVHDHEYIAHVPTKESFVISEIRRLVDYANDKDSDKFTHPIIKAVFLHFWIGYLHPFVDGNGRLARSIFYWYLLRKGYWTMLYLPISTVIKKSRKQYDNAYIYAEQDDLDVTYFFDYHIRKMIQAIDEFQEYIKRVLGENKLVEDKLSEYIDMNNRQKQLIYYLVEEGKDSYATVTAHSINNSISRVTSTKDIKSLLEKDLLVAKRVGKFTRYYPSRRLLNLAITPS